MATLLVVLLAIGLLVALGAEGYTLSQSKSLKDSNMKEFFSPKKGS